MIDRLKPTLVKWNPLDFTRAGKKTVLKRLNPTDTVTIRKKSKKPSINRAYRRPSLEFYIEFTFLYSKANQKEQDRVNQEQHDETFGYKTANEKSGYRIAECAEKPYLSVRKIASTGELNQRRFQQWDQSALREHQQKTESEYG